MAPAGKKCRVARAVHKKKGKKAGPKSKTKVKVVKPGPLAAGGKKRAKVHRQKGKARVHVAKKGACGDKAAAPTGPQAL